MEIGEPHALAVQLVEVGSFDHGISVRRYFAVSLIIRDDENDVGFRRGFGRSWNDGKDCEKQA